MLKITKTEMKYLFAKGFKFGDDLHRDYSGHGNYWVTEGRKIMSVLDEYRKTRTIETHE